MSGYPQSLDVPVHGRALHVRVRGEGPTVLLVHGLGATAHIWERFDLPGYRLVAVDLPGCGWSEPRSGRQGPLELGALLTALMERMSPEPFAAIGHSMGALAVLEMALSSPERVKASVLVDVPVELPLVARLTSAPLLGEALFTLPAFAPVSRTAVKLYLTWLFGDPKRLSREVVEAYAIAGGRPHYWKAMLAGLRGIADWVQGKRLETLRVPTVVVWGQEDPLIPVAVGRRLAGLLPDAEFVPLPGCGHSPPDEAPDALAAVVRSLFERKAGFVPAEN